jgi:hypothetical protein
MSPVISSDSDEKIPKWKARRMKRNAYLFCFFAFTLALLSGCSSKPSAQESKKAATAPDKIQGKLQLLDEPSASDAALNAGGNSVYLWVGPRRYRLFLKTRPELVHGHEYIAEGVWAQRAIDEIGDPAQGANGYPLEDSCRRVVTMAWPGLAFDAIDTQTGLVCARVKRYPARPLFLVTKIQPVNPDEGAPDSAKAKKAEAEKIHEITVPAEKQRALLLEGSPVQPAPLWQTAGGKATCKVAIDPEGKIDELLSGLPLCEAVDWSKFHYKPTLSGGRPVYVNSDVEVQFEPKK